MEEDQGGKVFKAIVKGVEARVEVVKETVVDAASGTMGKINSGLESGMASVMHTFGVPMRNGIQTLTRKVDALTKSVEHKAKSARKATVRKVKKATAAVQLHAHVAQRDLGAIHSASAQGA